MSPEPVSWEHGAAEFETTHWSVILAAGDSVSPIASEALEQLCRAYWYPLYAFVRRSGYDPEMAKDLTQGFFERLLEKKYLQDADRSRGRFRSFLLGSMKHFLANEWDRRTAQRRGGLVQIVPLDERLIGVAERQDQGLTVSPDSIYERRWAMALLESAREKLAKEYAAADKGALFQALRAALAGERPDCSYAQIGLQLGMTVAAVKKAAERLRRRYGQLLREVVAQTVANPADIDEEIRYLRAALQA